MIPHQIPHQKVNKKSKFFFLFETSFSNKTTLKFFHSNSKAEKILD